MHYLKTLSFSEKKRLVEALLACSVMADHARRQSVLRQLRVEIETSIAHDNANSTHLFNIVEACVQYQDGIEELIEIVQFFEKHSIAYEELEETVEDIYRPRVVRKAQRDELLAIVSGMALPAKKLLKLYRESLPFGAQINRQANSLRPILRHLALFPRQVGEGFPVPILEFVERLALHISNDEVRGQVYAWTEARAKELSVPQGELTALRRQPGATSESTAQNQYLLIQLERKAEEKQQKVTDKTRLIVRAWLLGGQNEREVTPSEEFYTLNELPQMIEEELLEKVFNEPIENLTIEFLLPNDLICLEVENWGLPDDDPIGIQYPVVVRLQDRFKRGKYKPRWDKCWKQVDLLQAVQRESVIWHHTDANQMWRTLRAALDPEHIICLALTFMPPTVSQSKRDILSLIVRSGTPIAIWPRLHADAQADEIRQELETLLANGPLEELPELVRKKRLEAWERGGDKHLTLLWDDPTRVPPPMRQLTAPRWQI